MAFPEFVVLLDVASPVLMVTAPVVEFAEALFQEVVAEPPVRDGEVVVTDAEDEVCDAPSARDVETNTEPFKVKVLTEPDFPIVIAEASFTVPKLIVPAVPVATVPTSK